MECSSAATNKRLVQATPWMKLKHGLQSERSQTHSLLSHRPLLPDKFPKDAWLQTARFSPSFCGSVSLTKLQSRWWPGHRHLEVQRGRTHLPAHSGRVGSQLLAVCWTEAWSPGSLSREPLATSARDTAAGLMEVSQGERESARRQSQTFTSCPRKQCLIAFGRIIGTSHSVQTLRQGRGLHKTGRQGSLGAILEGCQLHTA